MVGIDEYMSVTDDEIYEAKAGRDYDAGSVYEQMLPSETANISADQIAAMVSADAHDMILKFEVTGRSFYESRYRNPIWPGLASGITVGIGFDVGHHSELDFETAWKGILPEPAYSQLGETVGVTGASAKMLLDNVAEVDIDWQTALRVYHGFTVPKFGRMTANAFPNSKALPPQCFGALLSLVYNRGPSMKGEKRVHMRNIRQHLLDGKPHLVPAEIRAMKSIWPPTFSGLHKRREAEAKLFDRGLFGRDRLVAMAASAAAPVAPAAVSLEAAGAPFESVGLEGDGVGYQDVDYGSETVARVRPDLESDRWASVTWVRDDENSTEYAHILDADRNLRGCTFDFGGRDLELLLRANSFAPLRDRARIVFALRGAELVATADTPNDRLAQVDRTTLKLKECRPNHRDMRCTIGVYDLVSGRLSGFTGSTVLNPQAVLHGKAKGGNESNLLPAGCFRYVVGTHNKKVPSSLREGEPFAVLRNSNNFSFEISDRWSSGWPYDNIHPAASCGHGSAPFSSYGCLVIKGTYRDGQHRGEWAQFRKALGLDGTRDGDAYSAVLVTGLEAAIASNMRVTGQDGDAASVRDRLGRLRQGSQGPTVAALQQALARLVPDMKVPQTSVFDAQTKIALVAAQAAAHPDDMADGVFAPATDAILGLNILTVPNSPSPSMVVVAALEAVARSPMVPIAVRESAGGPAASPRGELEALYHELGRRVRLAERDPASLTKEHLPALEGWSDDIMRYGQRVALRIERAANRVMCGDSQRDVEDRATLWRGIEQGLAAVRQASAQPDDGEPNASLPTSPDATLQASPEAMADMATNMLATGLTVTLGLAPRSPLWLHASSSSRR